MPFATSGDRKRARSESSHAAAFRYCEKTSYFQMDGRQPRDRSRVFWTAAHDHTLLELMMDQVRRGGKLGNGFRKDSWKHILSAFNSKFSLRYDVQQLKHRLKYYRNQYRLVKAFLDRGFSWNSMNYAVTAPAHLWDTYIKENPLASRYKDKRWPYYEDWCRIFAQSGVIEGYNADASPTNDNDEEIMMEDSMGGSDPQQSDTPPGSPRSIQEVNYNPNLALADDGCGDGCGGDQEQENNIDTPRFQKAVQRRNSWKCKASPFVTTPVDVIDAVPVKALHRIDPREDRWPVEKCIEQLNSMEELEEELFLKALVAFRDEYNRRVFLSIKEDQRKGWLRLICG